MQDKHKLTKMSIEQINFNPKVDFISYVVKLFNEFQNCHILSIHLQITRGAILFNDLHYT